MTDLDEAFGSPFHKSCDLTFDVVPLFSEESREWMGVVTLQASNIKSFKYQVFSATSSQQDNTFSSNKDASIEGAILYQTVAQDTRKKQSVIHGTVYDCNNYSFCFPIADIKDDYFVLVTPTFDTAKKNFGGAGQQPHVETPATIPPPRVEFAIFYTSRIVKERYAKIAKRSAAAARPKQTFRAEMWRVNEDGTTERIPDLETQYEQHLQDYDTEPAPYRDSLTPEEVTDLCAGFSNARTKLTQARDNWPLARKDDDGIEW